MLVDRRRATLGVGRGGDPRLHDPGGVAAVGFGTEPHVRAECEVAPRLVEHADEALERGRREGVVPVEEPDVRRLDQLEPRVARCAQAALVPVMHQPEARVGGSGIREDLGRPVGRPVVDEDRRPVVARLRPQRVERLAGIRLRPDSRER